jgi:hypothetical protein
MFHCSFHPRVRVVPFASWISLDEAGRLFLPLAPPAPYLHRSPQLCFLLAELLTPAAPEAL